MSLTTSFIHILQTPFNFRHQILENWISAVGRLWFSAPQFWPFVAIDCALQVAAIYNMQTICRSEANRLSSIT